MSKIYIKTVDIFNNKDVNVRQKYFNSCHQKALKFGLQCVCHIENDSMTLGMEGNKSGFVRYYLATLFKTENKIDGIKRLMSIILTH